MKQRLMSWYKRWKKVVHANGLAPMLVWATCFWLAVPTYLSAAAGSGVQTNLSDASSAISVTKQTPTEPPSQGVERLEKLGNKLVPLTGPWIKETAFLEITWLQLLLSATILVLTLMVEQVLRRVLRRVIKRSEAKAPLPPGTEKPKPSRLKLILEAIIPPLSLLVWIWGLYLALMLLFSHYQVEGKASLILRALHWLNHVGSVAALFWLLFRMITVAEVRLKHWASTTASKWDDVMVALVVRALRLLTPLLAVILIVPTFDIPAAYLLFFKQGAGLVLIGAVGFILYQLVSAGEEAVLAQFRIDVKDNLEARKVYTQVKVLKKIAVFVIVIFTASSMLMVFDSVRQLGTSILASAGIVGIIVGFAAQRSIATLLAGFQIAMTQPIRLDDVVIVENEWGRIEEITLTYVVVRIWDLRRLIVPINYFIEKPFQNWTRVSADLLGGVTLYMDYTVPLEAVRAELDRILDNTPLWDKKVKVLQVTDAKENTLELRVLISAPDAGTAWDLRCLIREQLVVFLQKHHPQSLPRFRAELTPLLGGEPQKPEASRSAS